MLIYYLCSRETHKCGSAGIGRQARLRILCMYLRVGSSPIFRSSSILGKPYKSRLPNFFVSRYFVPKCSQSIFPTLQGIIQVFLVLVVPYSLFQSAIIRLIVPLFTIFILYSYIYFSRIYPVNVYTR